MDQIMSKLAEARPATLILVPFLLLVTFAFGKLIQRAYFTPLASIPGPWHAKFTSLGLVHHAIKARRVQYIHHLHQVYGPVVRIAPNEVNVTDLQGYQIIHKIGNGYCKSQWYPRFRTPYVDQDVFSETDPKSHAFRRKILSRPFSKSNLRQNWERQVHEKAQRAVQKIKIQAETGICNVFEWWTFYALDVIGQIAFGESFGMLELGQKTEFVRLFENVGLVGILRSTFYTVYKLVHAVPSFIYDINANEDRIIEYGRRVIDKTKEGSVDTRNVFTGFLTASEKTEGGLPIDTIVTEATGLIGAGGGTTAVTLTYLVWAVLSNPHIQQQLEQEVATLPSEFTDAELEALPYLNAVIEETLRAYGPIPGSLSRVVPAAGLQTGGYYIPPGTIVCTQAYTMHRKPEIFPNPEIYDPERFLQKGYALQEQKSAFFAFGAGSRTCLGMHLAYMELRVAVTLFFRECAGARLALSAPDDMNMVNFFGGRPKGRSCGITLRQN